MTAGRRKGQNTKSVSRLLTPVLSATRLLYVSTPPAVHHAAVATPRPTDGGSVSRCVDEVEEGLTLLTHRVESVSVGLQRLFFVFNDVTDINSRKAKNLVLTPRVIVNGLMSADRYWFVPDNLKVLTCAGT